MGIWRSLPSSTKSREHLVEVLSLGFMSQRQSHSNSPFNQNNKKKYVPKTHKNQNPNPTTLSTSLRQSSSNVANQTTRTPATHSGSFVNYLPQDEAVAAGFGAEEGGLDPVESQKVVDLLNRELSNLLKLNPRNFWREGLPFL